MSSEGYPLPSGHRVLGGGRNPSPEIMFFFAEDGAFYCKLQPTYNQTMSDCKTVQAVAPVFILAPEESGEVSISGDRLVRMSGNGSPPVGPGAESWLGVYGAGRNPPEAEAFLHI